MGYKTARWGVRLLFGIPLGTPLEVHPNSLSDVLRGQVLGDPLWVYVEGTAAGSGWQFLSKVSGAL